MILIIIGLNTHWSNICTKRRDYKNKWHMLIIINKHMPFTEIASLQKIKSYPCFKGSDNTFTPI